MPTFIALLDRVIKYFVLGTFPKGQIALSFNLSLASKNGFTHNF